MATPPPQRPSPPRRVDDKVLNSEYYTYQFNDIKKLPLHVVFQPGPEFLVS